MTIETFVVYLFILNIMIDPLLQGEALTVHMVI